jgi:hypothetical protein
MNAEEFGVKGAAQAREAAHVTRPTDMQRKWLIRGLEQPGGKLPLFDAGGQRVSKRTIDACLRQGWAEPWFANPLKPDWQVCKLTERGRKVLEGR